VRAAPTAHEASRVDEYIRWTLYGVKPDTASPPLKSLQIREEEVAAGEADAESVDGVRMTMFYYNCSGPKGAPPCSDASSGHFPWRRRGHCGREGVGGDMPGLLAGSAHPRDLGRVHAECRASSRPCPGVEMRGPAPPSRPCPATLCVS